MGWTRMIGSQGLIPRLSLHLRILRYCQNQKKSSAEIQNMYNDKDGRGMHARSFQYITINI